MLPTASAITTLRRTVPFPQVHDARGYFGEEVKNRIRTDRHDRGHFQPEDENGEQQHAAPHSTQADENADDKANQNFGS